MDKKLALQQIENIIKDLKKENIHDNLINYGIIISIFNGLNEIAKDEKTPLYESYKKELLFSLEAICSLNDGNGHPFEQHLSWSIGALKKLKSVHCFDIK